MALKVAFPKLWCTSFVNRFKEIVWIFSEIYYFFIKNGANCVQILCLKVSFRIFLTLRVIPQCLPCNNIARVFSNNYDGIPEFSSYCIAQAYSKDCMKRKVKSPRKFFHLTESLIS